ncbi:MFS transporter [Dactylosporangium sp. CS-033363]|uniref:MFS transporter n=1 Tax=Dactylosporangium sp. CS-033363 TaxID=3239935 RepID=UPI003D8BB58D
MYLSTVDKPATGPAAAGSRRSRIAVTVLALGTVSLITDISSEMVTAILPLYLMLGLHLGPLGYGVVDGLYTGATALLRVAGGYLADRIRRRKVVALAGYGISAVAKLGLLAAGSSVPLLSGVIVADRAGKGLRTAPRDALITLSTPPDRLGRAFGVHRAMDSVGAFLGPLAAVAVLGASAQSFDAVFVTSFCVAALGVFVLATFVPDHRGPAWLAPTPSDGQSPPREAQGDRGGDEHRAAGAAETTASRTATVASTTHQHGATTADRSAATTAEQHAATTASRTATVASTTHQHGATTADRSAATTAEQHAATTASRAATVATDQHGTVTAHRPAATTAPGFSAAAGRPPVDGTPPCAAGPHAAGHAEHAGACLFAAPPSPPSPPPTGAVVGPRDGDPIPRDAHDDRGGNGPRNDHATAIIDPGSVAARGWTDDHSPSKNHHLQDVDRTPGGDGTRSAADRHAGDRARATSGHDDSSGNADGNVGGNGKPAKGVSVRAADRSLNGDGTRAADETHTGDQARATSGHDDSGVNGNERVGGNGKPAKGVSVRAAAALLQRRDFRLVVLAATVMGLATIGDGFVYLVLQRQHDVAAGWFPLLAVGTNLAYLLLAVPLGQLADRVGRAKVYLGGFGALILVYLLLGAGLSGTPALWVTVGLYGTFYAATDGVLMAVAGPLLPAALKTTGIALVQSGQSLAYLGSSVLFGLAWQLWGAGPALLAASVVALAALLLVATILLRGTTKHA